jgi:uncharacterized protein (UPF0262 family)
MTEPAAPTTASTAVATKRLVHIALDPRSIGRTQPAIEHERDVAIFDLLESNSFAVAGHDGGPYKLLLGIVGDRLTFAVRSDADAEIATFMLSLSPFRRIVRDYFIICESYNDAIRTLPPSRIEAIDMGRRSMHDDGSRLLSDRLKDKVEIDFATSRRLFTLICALHWKG